MPSTGRFLLLIRIIYFCLAPCGLAGRGSERDQLHQGLGSLSPRGRGESTCGDRDRAERRQPRHQPDPAPRPQHDRARATRDLPGRAGCPAAGSRGARSGIGPPGGTWDGGSSSRRAPSRRSLEREGETGRRPDSARRQHAAGGAEPARPGALTRTLGRRRRRDRREPRAL